MPENGPIRLNDIALHQIKRLPVDPNITFIGGLASLDLPLPDGEAGAPPHLVVWIARHSVLPDQPQPRAATVADQGDAYEAILNTLVEAIIPTVNQSLAPMLPGRIEVADAMTATILHEALEGLSVEVAVAEDMTLVEALAAGLIGDLRQRFAPIPPWDVPVEILRDLTAAAVNLFRRDPWQSMEETPVVAIPVNRYGLDTLYFSLTYGNQDTEGVVAYCSLEDMHWASRINFLLEQLQEANGEVINLDVPPADVAIIEQQVRHPEHGLGEAFTIFFEPLSELNDVIAKEFRTLKLPLAPRKTAPIFTRVSRVAPPRRPNVDEARGLRLAIDAFNQFFARYRERIEDEAWHFGPISATVSLRDGDERVPLRLTMTSPAPSLKPALRDAVLLLRVMLAHDVTVWREIEVLARQPLWELDHAIQESFGWPVRVGSFLPRDDHDGEETFESRLIDDLITRDNAPIGLLVHEPRDFCHYMFDVKDKGISHRIRLISTGPKDSLEDYPRLVRSHGEIPPIYSPEDYEVQIAAEDDDDDGDEIDQDDDDE